VYIATIDTGTTNTRVNIWDKDNVIGVATCAVGVRDTAITGNKDKMSRAIQETLAVATAAANLRHDNIGLVLATGMLTSNVGLIEIPHVAAPVDVKYLAANMVEHYIPSICQKPIWFIPGVRNTNQLLPADQAENMDIMRGEEVEVFGLMAKINIDKSAIFILPGSHNKFVSINLAGQITGCMTTLAGELLGVLSKNTILADAVGHGFSTKLESHAFFQGVQCYRKLGLGRAAFTVRILDQFTKFTLEEQRSYLLGVVLADDIQALQHSEIFRDLEESHIIIAGKPVVQQGFQLLLADHCRHVITVDAAIQANISGYGAVVIAKQRGLLS